MGMGGGAPRPSHDGYPGALYDLQKEELFPAVFEQQEALQMEQLGALQGNLAGGVTQGLFRDIDLLTESAEQQNRINSQIRQELGRYSDRELKQFADITFGEGYSRQSGFSMDKIIRDMGEARSALRGGGRGSTRLSRRMNDRYVATARGRSPHYSDALLRNRSPEENKADDAYYAQFGGRRAYVDMQDRRRREGKMSGYSTLEGLGSRYIANQERFMQEQLNFQSRQLQMQERSLFQEQASYDRALAQQQAQFDAEQAQRQEAYDKYLAEQQAANEQLMASQQRIEDMSQSGRARSAIAERTLTRMQGGLSNLFSRRQGVRQEQAKVVSPQLGSRDKATGLFGQRREPR